MGVQPRSLRAGLTAAAAVDRHAEAGLRRSPRPRPAPRCRAATPVTITGTASDQGGGVVGGVEVSVDGGATWRAATGTGQLERTSWTPAALEHRDTAGDVAEPRGRRQRQHRDARSPGVTVIGRCRSAGWSRRTASARAAGRRSPTFPGSGNTGTISGATWTAGRFGQALSFDGVNDLVTVNDANSLDLTTGMTLEAWVYPTALSGWQSAILKQTTTTAWLRAVRQREPAAAGADARTASDINTPGVAPLPAEHLDASGGDVRRIHGPPVRQRRPGQQQSRRRAACRSRPGRLASAATRSGASTCKGSIDEVRIYNRAAERRRDPGRHEHGRRRHAAARHDCADRRACRRRPPAPS